MNMPEDNKQFDPTMFKNLVEMQAAFPDEAKNFIETEDGQGFVRKTVLSSDDAEREVSSEKIARQKLEELMADLKDFSIRFVNMAEYAEIVEQQHLPSGQVFVFKSDYSKTDMNPFLRGYYPFKDKRGVNVLEYIQEAANLGWSEVALEQTDWAESVEIIRRYQKLMQILKQAHNDAKTQKESQQSIRERTLAIFKEKSKKYVTDDSYLVSISDQTYEDTIRFLKELDTPGFDEKNVDEIVEIIDRNTGQPVPEGYLFWPELQMYILQFKDNVEEFDRIWPTVAAMVQCRILMSKHDPVADFAYGEDSSKETFRAAFNKMALSYNPRSKDIMKADGWDRPYHIAMIFGNKAISNADRVDRWGSIDEDKADDGGYLLGAVACIPDRELWDKMISLSERAINFSHPVFDSHGFVRYPSRIE